MKWSEYSIVLVMAITVIGIAMFHYKTHPDMASALPDGASASPTTGDSVQAKPRSSPQFMSNPSGIPNFSAYKDVKAKKRDFFGFMLPMVRKVNDEVLADRNFLKSLNPKSITAGEEQKLRQLADHYRLKEADSKPPAVLIEELLPRTDIVPASLILAQSANESAWGTSRFAKMGNNLFGLWCFTPGCGITPGDRKKDLKHEVATFDSVQDSVRYYVHTINSHPAYQKLRTVRKQQREAEEKLSGIELATGLQNYSERGHEYVDEIQSMILYNELEKYNRTTTLPTAESEQPTFGH